MPKKTQKRKWKRTFYHGGVPGGRPGGLIYPAAELGLDYTAAYLLTPGLPLQMPKYEPDRVHFTTHLGVARGYAAQYVAPGVGPVPGDVYRVIVDGPIETDPDFSDQKVVSAYGTSRKPITISAVVERDVVLDRRQINEAGWPYRCFFGEWEPVHAKDGTVLASHEMRDLGATDDYLRLLPRWMDAREFGNGGRLWSPGREGVVWASPDEVLEVLSHLKLDTGPHIMTGDNVYPRFQQGSNKPILFGYYQCRECGATFGDPTISLDEQTPAIHAAAIHQAGDDLVTIAQFNGGNLNECLYALSRRSPQRWTSWRPPGLR